jgi:hypothetical protein
MTLSIYLTGRLNIKTGSIDRTCRTPCSLQGSLYILRYFIHTYHEDDMLGSPSDGCYAIAITIDVDNDAVF